MLDIRGDPLPVPLSLALIDLDDGVLETVPLYPAFGNGLRVRNGFRFNLAQDYSSTELQWIARPDVAEARASTEKCVVDALHLANLSVR